MTLSVYIGTSDEITERLVGAPDATVTTVTSASSKTVFSVASAAHLSSGDKIVLEQQKRTVLNVDGSSVTVSKALNSIPSIGSRVKLYDADYSGHRDGSVPFAWDSDIKTGGRAGDTPFKELLFFDYNAEMAEVTEGSRMAVFDSAEPTVCIFGGSITNVKKTFVAQTGTRINFRYAVTASGYQDEADSIGIEEPPVVNINAGVFIKRIMQKYTNLTEGEIDVTNSPTIDFIRIANYRRFSDICRELSSLWIGSEFYIDNDFTGGKVYFRQAETRNTSFTLSKSFLAQKSPFNVSINKDLSKTYSIVRLPFYRLQKREPDFFVQDTVADNAFLKTSFALNGIPTNIDESILLLGDFADGSLQDSFTEDDLTNPSPPDGFIGSDGFMLEGELNTVTGLHLLDASGSSAVFGDIGRITNPAEVEPFTGEERQMIFAKEVVINTIGEGAILGVIDNTTIISTVQSGATTTSIPLDDATGFVIGDRVDIEGSKSYITNIVGDTLTVSPAVTAPDSGDAVTLHRLAKSRIKFAVYFNDSGDLKYIKDGVEQDFDTPRTYTDTTYSFRLFMQSFDTTVSGGASTTGVTLTDATSFVTGDIVDIFTKDDRNLPETRAITVAGSDITYLATDNTPSTGYRVRTKPKMVLQVKGGVFGDINGRDWETIYTAENTWWTSTVKPDSYGVLLAMGVSLEATISLFQMKNPPAITAKIVDTDRYLHLATQEVETSEKDVDAIVRKVGSHYQIDFFPDTKALIASGYTLRLDYDEKFLYHVEDYNTEAMVEIASLRGFALTGNETEQDLKRLGGRVLDTIELLPNPITLEEAINQTSNLINAVSEVQVTVEILTNTYSDSIVSAGQIISSTLARVPNLQVERVTINELNVKGESNESLYSMRIVAGSVDRLSDVLLQRKIKNSKRVVIDDGVDDDSFTKLQKLNLAEKLIFTEEFTTHTCSSPTKVIYDGAEYTKMRCLQIG